MASTTKWRGQEATLTLEDDTGSDVPIGILQEFEVEVSREVSRLFGAGSIKSQDIMQTEVTVNVSGEVMAWDSDTFDTLVDYTGSELKDNSDVPPFTAITTIETTDGTTKTLSVDGVVFEDLPIGGSRDEWIGISLDGTGEDLAIL